MREQESERLRASLAACEQGSTSILEHIGNSIALERFGGSGRASTVVPLLGHAEHRSMLCSNMLVHNTSFQAIQGFRNPTIEGDGRPSGFVGEGFLGLEFPVCLFGIDSPLKTGGADTDEVTMQPHIAHLIMEQLQELLANQLMEYARHFCWTD